MTSTELENLVRIGKLKREPPSPRELSGLLASARTRLADAGRGDLAFDSRFDLAYNAAHALALFALRRLGYRSDNRYLVFQCLPHSLACRSSRGACWPKRTSVVTSPSTKDIWSATIAC
jgi:hypothetical protein